MKMSRLKRVGTLWAVGVLSTSLATGCISSFKPNPAPAFYDLGEPKSQYLTLDVEHSGRDIIIIPEILVSGAINTLAIVYRYTNVMENEAKSYSQSRWAQHPAELVRFRVQQYLGALYPVSITSELESSESWILRISLEEFSQHISSDTESKGVVQLRATLVRNGLLVNQRMFRSAVAVEDADVKDAVKSIANATDEVLLQVTHWVDEQIKLNRK